MTKLTNVIQLMLKKDANDLDEFDKTINSLKRRDYIYKDKYGLIGTLLEIKRIKNDKERCENLINYDGTTIPIMMSLESREIMRDVICYLLSENKEN